MSTPTEREVETENTKENQGEKDANIFVAPAAPKDVEKEQEMKLRSKYPGLKGPGSSAFLQKRLSKGQKYFDSGDYNMAKARGAPGVRGAPVPVGKPVPPVLPGPTGDAIPTPDKLQQRKPSLVTSKLASGSLS